MCTARGGAGFVVGLCFLLVVMAFDQLELLVGDLQASGVPTCPKCGGGDDGDILQGSGALGRADVAWGAPTGATTELGPPRAASGGVRRQRAPSVRISSCASRP